MTSTPENEANCPIVDASAFVHEYPFRGFPQTSPHELQLLGKRYGVTRAVISSFHEIFWQNNFDAARRLAQEVGENDFLTRFVTVNPIYPRQLEDLPALITELGVAGLRLFPNYHGYRLWDEPVTELFALASELNLPVQIFREIQDVRLQWMRPIPPVADEDFDRLLAAPPSDVSLLLCGFTSAGIASRREKLAGAPRVWVDVSRVRGPVFAVEELARTVGPEKLVFGSLWPIQMVAPVLRPVQETALDVAARGAILGGNWHRFAGKESTGGEAL